VHMRERMKRNFLATLAFSQGVVMLSHGDELGRTQAGNNNAYCQDSPLTWVDWRLTPAQQQQLEFTRAVLAIRSATPLLQRRDFFRHESQEGIEKELVWLGADGQEMTPEAWHQAGNHVLGMLMQAQDEALLLVLNGGGRSKPFLLPSLGPSAAWTELVNTCHPGPPLIRHAGVTLAPRSLLLLQQTRSG
jgi:isoamylase